MNNRHNGSENHTIIYMYIHLSSGQPFFMILEKVIFLWYSVFPSSMNSQITISEYM